MLSFRAIVEMLVFCSEALAYCVLGQNILLLRISKHFTNNATTTKAPVVDTGLDPRVLILTGTVLDVDWIF